ncbi:hypothetical protein BU24DRAFT_5671 [Aaosphaeria arxii CBS 175.79]|uniref:Uncharacterized protein n=1 Tax=Aaosphaeria arxii CBS 175.79 TaxID=1450172 RepID=A0A6A5Y5U3_9PLEO|nr:uncharacterized protein BU24DRAFT_5671 [Aaosphaeria arxii CBS 175.79]KAF2020659.1 hypothetical protein BU24DRAFT_5671 [Aaosphaeria arxii CBS 175.79]
MAKISNLVSASSLEDLKSGQFNATTSFDPLLTSNELRSTYHVYHKRERHAVLTTAVDSTRERWSGPNVKELKAERIQRKLSRTRTIPCPGNQSTELDAVDNDASFLLYTPYLSFHDPPRVLYTQTSNVGVPLMLIHTKSFWRSYKLQFGPSIAKPGVIDPRGVVSWKNNGGDKKILKSDDQRLKGYKVKTWRLWGEGGKEYVHNLRAKRKANVGPDPDVLEDETEAIDQAAVRAEYVVYLKWTSPFSRDTRRYHFHFEGIDFYWKGTGTVKETRTCGIWCHFSHLKLVAKLPATEDGQQLEVCLGKYTSSIASKKHGTLDLFDGAIWHLMVDYMPSALPRVSREGLADSTQEQLSAVKKTWLYNVIVATSMCMILGEKHKRATVRQILEAAASEGGGGGG